MARSDAARRRQRRTVEPMRRIPLAALVAVVATAGFAVWWFLVRDDAPSEAALPERTASDTTEPEQAPAAATPDGEWVVVPADETFAGFRITEMFPGVDNLAVMRTQAVSGTLVVIASSITDVTVEADLTELESLDSVPPGVPGIENRANQMRDDGLETDTYPTATFVLAEPIELDAPPAEGEPVAAEAIGDLTIHGATNRVSIPIEARWSGDIIDVAGSLDVALADHGIDPPERPFVSVADTGTMELQLVFERAD